ncbi:hypothetical protein EDD16DRAFT_1558577 [Pisolithus croceorrhizus]|nr:hypothetical protein EDD16DRAFT_1558577 [Pisolithus croceorrhizus]KAI6149002.1 hypothetical protein EDD17DRAFT_1222246 [Pisolithus thermaeus]
MDTLTTSTNCENRRYRDNEVTSDAAISEKGKIITPRIKDREALSRDILKAGASFLVYVSETRFRCPKFFVLCPSSQPGRSKYCFPVLDFPSIRAIGVTHCLRQAIVQSAQDCRELSRGSWGLTAKSWETQDCWEAGSSSPVIMEMS